MKTFIAIFLNYDRVLKDSICLKKPTDREEHDYPGIVQTGLYYNIDVRNGHESEERTAANTKIKENIKTWLESLEFELTDGKADKDDIEDLKECIASNKQLLKLGQKIKSLLNLERDRLDGRVLPKSQLFLQDVLSAQLDVSKTRCVFNMNPKLFLQDKSILIVFLPKILSYALGGLARKSVKLGPMDHTMPFSVTPRLSNEIRSPSQQLYSNIRFAPSQIHVLTDIASNRARDHWLENTEFSEFQILHSYLFDEETFRSGTIMTVQSEGDFIRLKQTSKMME